MGRSENGGEVQLEVSPAVNVAHLVKVIAGGGVDKDKFLQTSHSATAGISKLLCDLGASQQRIPALTLLIHCTPKMVRLTIQIHENLVRGSLPIGIGAGILDTVPADLSGEKSTKTVPPETN